MTDQIIPDARDFERCHRTNGPEQTRDWGRRLAGLLTGGEIVLLYGPLGAGKTCLVQGICDALDVTDEVVSPTFTIVGSYNGRLPVHHLDLYRIEADHDLTDIGLPDLMDDVWDGRAVLLVEWPEPLLAEFGTGDRRIEILALPGETPDERVWHVRGVPDLPASWLAVTEAAGA